LAEPPAQLTVLAFNWLLYINYAV